MSTNKNQPMVVLRDVANQAGKNVGWDGVTGNVSIGDQQFTPQQLQGMGGQLVGDRWQIPQSMVQSFIPNQTQPQQTPNRGFDDMSSMARNMSQSHLQQQQSQLQLNKTAQVTELKKAYEQAIADGQISVREAEQQFNQQKLEIEQQAYLDGERTSLYGQSMGIQNSQQMIGLMQGDNERRNNMINKNVSERDIRVNNVRDKLNAIRSAKNLDLARVNSEYESGLLRAQGESNQMYSQNMFNVMQGDYNANRDQRFTQDNMRFGDTLQRGQMELGQSFNRENIEVQFQNTLKQATHDSGLAIGRMNIQHGLNLQTMAQSLKDDITKMRVSFGHQSSLQSQSNAHALNRIGKEYELQVKAEEDAYNRELKRNLRGVTPGTSEYKIIKGNAERQFRENLTQLHLETVYQASSDVIMNDPALSGSTARPKDWTANQPLGNLDPVGGFMNWLTGYEDKSREQKATMEAIRRRDEMLNSVTPFLPWAK